MSYRSSGSDFEAIRSDVTSYYETRLTEHGATARGVDWNGAESQILRFSQLARVLPEQGAFSINDIGCGYGALYDFLSERYPEFVYCGTDISTEMIAVASNRLAASSSARFVDSAEPDEVADYGIASGIFNVRLTHGDEEWWAYFVEMLDMIHETSRCGFAFNCLTSYSDPDFMRGHLFYADPGAVFDLCKRKYSRHVALLHDYGLYEFTILVRKEL